MTRPDRRPGGARGERGSAVVELTWLALLLLVPLVYVVLAVAQVQSASFGLSAASRAGARAFTLAPDEASARRAARQAVSVTLADHGVRPGQVGLRVTCHPVPRDCLRPGAVVDVTLTGGISLPLVPEALGGGRPVLRLAASHRVAYGSFREDR